MLFLGTTFCGGRMTATPTPSVVDKVNYVEIENGKYGGFYATNEVTSNPTGSVPDEWDFDTIFRGNYASNKPGAGNVDWTLENVTHVVLKRRVRGTLDWVTVFVKEIKTEDDFNFAGIDKNNQGNAIYEYALIPYKDKIPGKYNTFEIKSQFNSIFIVGQDKTYFTFSTNGFVDTTRNISGNYNVPLNSRYPVFFKSGNMNYDSGSVEGLFFELDADTCDIVNDLGYEYKRGLMDFLTDGKPKLLKHWDGRTWLIQITPSPTDSASDYYKLRNISFDWIEIGDFNSNEDLYNAGLSIVDQAWWNN